MSKDKFKEEEIKTEGYREYTKEELKELEKDFRSARRDLQFMSFLLRVEKTISDVVTKVTTAVSSIFSCKKK